MLTVKNINYSYNKKIKALQDINFEVEQGDFLTIAGPNGSGKTTLIMLITDLLKLRQGSILIDDLAHDDYSSKKKVMYLSSEDYLPEFLTGYEYINMLCSMYDTKLDLEQMQRLAGYYSLEQKLDTLIEGYSHGMKKKVQLMSAFLIEAPILMIDETLNGIDVEAKEATKLLLKQYQKKGTILFCTHDLDLVEEISERVILINKGVIYIDSTITALLETETNLTDVFKKLINYEEMKDEITKYF